RPTDLYEHSTVARLTEHLASRVPLLPVIHPEPEKPTATQRPQQAQEPIAIIGMAGRWPGADNLTEFWNNLAAGRCATTAIPPGYWGEIATEGCFGGLLRDYDCFDSWFFQMSPLEAERMDPQQRLFLETAWATLEDAGYRPEQLRQQAVGVFVGAQNNHYGHQDAGSLSTIGNSLAILAGRIAYHLDLKGPSLTVDTACSSALVAIHLACQSLWQADCEMALAGGVSCMLFGSRAHEFFADSGMASPTGRCHTFAASANGFVAGDGVGAILLKPLAAAQRDRDQIYGVILGSATNQDGRTNGITAPSASAQTAVERRVYERFGIDPTTISCIETHGTGTALGDPIEVQGLTDAFRPDTDRRQFCALGSVKTNIGHTLTAAGVASVQKALLALQHRQLPPSLHFDRPNPLIPFEDTPFYVNTELRSWQAVKGQLRRVGVSGFGFSGTNVHLVIEEAPPVRRPVRTRRCHPVALSAHTETALRQRVQDLRDWLDRPETAGIDLADIAYTLNAGRAHFTERQVLLAQDRDELRQLLDQALRQPAPLIGQGDSSIRALAERYLAGETIDWNREYQAEPHWRISLPTYPFARERHWRQPDRQTPSPLAEPQQFSQTWTGEEWFWRDHQVQGRSLLPAAWSLHWMQSVAKMRGAGFTLSAVQWLRPLYGDQSPLTVKLELRPDGDSYNWRIFRESATGEEQYCQGRLQTGLTPTVEVLDLAAIRQRCPVTTTGEALYQRLRNMGFHYGPGFQALEQLWSNGVETLARLRQPAHLPEDVRQSPLSPSLLDAALQSLIGLLPDSAALPLPFALEALEWREPLPSPCYVYAEPSAAGNQCYRLRLCDEHGRVAAVLHDYQVRLLSPLPEEKALITQHYQVTWRDAPLLEATVLWPDDGATLLFLPQPDAVAKQLASQIQQRWHRFSSPVIVAQTGNDYRDEGQYRYQLDLTSPDHHHQLLQDLAQRGMTLARVLWLWPMTADQMREPPMLDASAALQRFLAGTQALLTVLPSWTQPESTVTIWNVVSDEFQAALFNGASRSLAWETPRLQLRTIQWQPSVAGDPVAWLMARLSGEVVASEPEVRLSESGRQIKTLMPFKPALTTSPWLPDGVYLISGGLGGIGLALAERLAQQGPVRLMLVGRSLPNVEQARRIQTLRERGATVETRQVDLTHAAEVNAVVQETVQRFGRLDGVIHGAAVTRDQFLINKDLSTLSDVLAPKLLGALHLDQATRDLPLRNFILLSSLAGVLGNAAQSDYAAANGGLDTFAVWRERLRMQGLRQGRTLALDLPPWRSGGLEIPAEREAELRRELGLVPLDTPTGLQALEAALTCPDAQCVILHGEPEALEQLAHIEVRGSNHPGASRHPSLSKEGNVDSADWVYQILRDLFARELKLPLERLKPETDFARYGIDSVVVLQLNRMLAEKFGPLPKTLLFEYHNLGDLAAYLLEKMPPSPPTPLPPAGEGSQTPAPLHSPNAEPDPITSPPFEKGGPGGISQPIAIIGISGRYPQADDLDAFWENLCQGRDCITEIPPDRWPLSDFFDPQPGQPGKSYSQWGGFLSDVDRFDPLFFHIAPRDAGFMDPQERLFLETAWTALEQSGYTPARLGHGQVGVFVGVMYGEYQLFAAEARRDGRFVPVYAPYWSIPNRVSYTMNWRGPSLAVDSACSSSL
ncbi:MAG: polyketide synthase PksL, partial [Pseudomonadota bacterium]|nr:polyketide synthase PksL [Pseudomonadota bacterium]